MTALAQELAQTSRETENHLGTSTARIALEGSRCSDGEVVADVTVSNLAGHKLPTAYPSRRAWIRFTVRDAEGRTVFESGAIQPDGSIRGNANDQDPDRFEEHYARIDSPEEVQIYEAIMADPEGRVTTGLIRAIRFIKDNRILPRGFEKAAASHDIAVQGRARQDEDFQGSGDTIRYAVRVDRARKPFTVEAELLYQPIAFRWAKNLTDQQAAEIDRFVSYYDSMSQQSWTVLARDEAIVR